MKCLKTFRILQYVGQIYHFELKLRFYYCSLQKILFNTKYLIEIFFYDHTISELHKKAYILALHV